MKKNFEIVVGLSNGGWRRCDDKYVTLRYSNTTRSEAIRNAEADASCFPFQHRWISDVKEQSIIDTAYARGIEIRRS